MALTKTENKMYIAPMDLAWEEEAVRDCTETIDILESIARKRFGSNKEKVIRTLMSMTKKSRNTVLQAIKRYDIHPIRNKPVLTYQSNRVVFVPNNLDFDFA